MSLNELAAPLGVAAAVETPGAVRGAKSDIRYCFVCKWALPAEARKCTHCDTWLRGWRRWFPLTEGSLSIVLAMISVLTVIVPRVVQTIGREALTGVAIVSTVDEGKDLRIAVSNAGRRPTVLRSFEVQFQDAGFLEPLVLLSRDPSKVLLLPEKSDVVDLWGPKRPLSRSQEAALTKWIATGTVLLTVCVKESGTGASAQAALDGGSSCESRGLVSRTDSMEAASLEDWIKRHIEWKE